MSDNGVVSNPEPQPMGPPTPLAQRFHRPNRPNRPMVSTLPRLQRAPGSAQGSIVGPHQPPSLHDHDSTLPWVRFPVKMHSVQGYQLIDVGESRRLERFGDHLVDRPQPGADDRRRAPERWHEADLVFDRERGWSGPGLPTARSGWSAELEGLTFELRPTDAGQVGLFPEHATMLPWLADQASRRTSPAVLNLFAYTGLVSVALAGAGASVAHVDAARSAVNWARRNAALNGLEERPIRWLVDDARAFAAREVRRGRRYDGVVLDPPTYGHGTSGKAWRSEDDLASLLDDVDRLLAADGFLLLTAHTAAIDPFSLGRFIGGDVEVGELVIEGISGAVSHLGAFARLVRAS